MAIFQSSLKSSTNPITRIRVILSGNLCFHLEIIHTFAWWNGNRLWYCGAKHAKAYLYFPSERVYAFDTDVWANDTQSTLRVGIQETEMWVAVIRAREMSRMHIIILHRYTVHIYRKNGSSWHNSPISRRSQSRIFVLSLLFYWIIYLFFMCLNTCCVVVLKQSCCANTIFCSTSYLFPLPFQISSGIEFPYQTIWWIWTRTQILWAMSLHWITTTTTKTVEFAFGCLQFYMIRDKEKSLLVKPTKQCARGDRCLPICWLDYSALTSLHIHIPISNLWRTKYSCLFRKISCLTNTTSINI